MDKIRNKNQNILYNLIYIFFVFTIVYLLGLGISLELNIILQVITVVIGSILVKFFLLNPLVLYVLLVFGFIILFLVHRYISPILFMLSERSIYLFQNIIYNLQGRENIASDNLLLFWGILIFLVSLFTAFIIFKNKNIYLLLPVYISTFIFYWYNFFDKAYWMISIFIFIFLILIGLNKYMETQIPVDNDSESESKIPYGSWLKTVIIYGFLIVFISLMLPKYNNYIQWPWLEKKIYHRFPSVSNFRSNDIKGKNSGTESLFSFSFSDYQKNPSKLGGPIILSDQIVMTVEGDSSHYLRGNVKQIYTGTMWRTIIEPSKRFSIGEVFSGLSRKAQRTYFNMKDITITNHTFASNTIFSPYIASEFQFHREGTLVVNRDHSLFLPTGVYDGESYSLKVQKPLPYGVLLSLGIDNMKEDIFDLETYLQIPGDISERTRALTREIVKDTDTDFHKAIAIESHLRNNYEYSLDVSPVPDGREFIDYFLFQEQKGYCTYYATSMAIMLRLEGIPSRYVEGYISKDSTDPGVYEVKHNNAHAWVEAFIKPVGWMTFEPTPAYPVESRLEDYKPKISNEDIVPTPSIERDEFLELDLREIIDDERDIVDKNGDMPWPEVPRIDRSDIRKKLLSIVIIVILLIVPIKFLAGLFSYIYKENKARKLPNKDRIIYLYNQILIITGSFGYPQKPGETHCEYANRVAYKFHYQNRKDIKQITEIFMKSKYSDYLSSAEDIMDLEEYRSSLESHLKISWGLRVYYYRKYIK